MTDLRAFLASGNWRTRREAVASLSGANAQALVDLLRDHSEQLEAVSAVLQALADIRPDLTAELENLLQSPISDTRLHATLGLGMLGDSRAVPALIRMLNDLEPNVRFHAVEALGRLRAREAAPLIRSRLNPANPFLTFAILHALGQIGDPESVPAITAFLDHPSLSEAALLALAGCGEEDAVLEAALRWFAAQNHPDQAAETLAGVIARLLERAPGASLDLAARLPVPTQEAVARFAAQARGEAAAQAAVVLAHLVRGEATSEAVLTGLAALLDEPLSRRLAANALAQAGPRGIGQLERAFRETDDEERADFLAALTTGSGGSPAALPIYDLAIECGSERLILLGIEGLRTVRTPEAYEALLTRLDRMPPLARRVAAGVLKAIAPDPALHNQRMLDLLESQNPHLREAALLSLNGGQAATSALSALPDAYEGVRQAAIEVLGRLGDPQALFALADALHDSASAVRQAAGRALARYPAEQALPHLLQAVRHPDPWTRYAACRSLAALQAPASLPILRDLTDDPFPPVRIAALEALAQLGGQEAHAIVRGSLDDPNFDVRTASHRALGEAE